MRDMCVIMKRQPATGNDPGDVAFADTDEIACGYYPRTKSQVLDNGSQATVTEAEIRLPWGTLIGTEDRIRITAQGGETLDPAPVYGVVGAPYGVVISVIVKALRLTPESVL